MKHTLVKALVAPTAPLGAFSWALTDLGAHCLKLQLLCTAFWRPVRAYSHIVILRAGWGTEKGVEGPVGFVTGLEDDCGASQSSNRLTDSPLSSAHVCLLLLMLGLVEAYGEFLFGLRGFALSARLRRDGGLLVRSLGLQ